MDYTEVIPTSSSGASGSGNGSNYITKQEFARVVDNLKNDISKVEHKVNIHERGIRDIEEEYTLMPAEGSDLTKAVQQKICEVMGGKKSPAYKNLKSLRKAIGRDIHREYKRQYGLIDEVTGREMKFDKLKRKYFKGALLVIQNYTLPITYQNQVDAENELGDLDD